MNLNISAKLKSFIANSKHVMSISYKPGPVEFNRTARIIIIGILVIGVIGFIISILVSLVTGVQI